ncbi:MAG: hypothetical protein MI749_15775 [Desulfovibrionales bacterium]|nr:hypothetical protein [Desulfovibrionales bacterium]
MTFSKSIKIMFDFEKSLNPIIRRPGERGGGRGWIVGSPWSWYLLKNKAVVVENLKNNQNIIK